MTRSQPVQKRSRERVEKILLAAADMLAVNGRPEDLTTTSVSNRSGIPVATVYRYFADRSAIIAALIDRETAAFDLAIEDSLHELGTITLESLLYTILNTHLDYFWNNKRTVVLWFGARQSRAVLERIEQRYEAYGDWSLNGWRQAGFYTPDAPDFGGEAIWWLSDRMFEFIFRAQRTRKQAQQILDEFAEMVTAQINKYATAAAIAGVPHDAFFAQVPPMPRYMPASAGKR